MKAIILTLAVAGFMSSAHAGVYKKTSDRQMLNKSSVDCIDKSSNGLNDDTNPNRTVVIFRCFQNFFNSFFGAYISRIDS